MNKLFDITPEQEKIIDKYLKDIEYYKKNKEKIDKEIKENKNIKFIPYSL